MKQYGKKTESDNSELRATKKCDFRLLWGGFQTKAFGTTSIYDSWDIDKYGKSKESDCQDLKRPKNALGGNFQAQNLASVPE